MIKLALAMIVKGSPEEAVLLSNCLANVAVYVDGIFITITQPSEEVEKVAKDYHAHVSHFEWCNDFSKARNFNFSQVPKDYTHILWADADDSFRGLSRLKKVIAEHPNTDVFSMNYLYHFNEYKQPDVVHMKTMVVKNNGCVEWSGALHEDFRETRSLRSPQFIKDIERLHLSEDDRIERAKKRNIEVSSQQVDQEPNDPRAYWNLAQSYMGDGMYKEAKETYEIFITKSNSDEEKYLAYINLSKICDSLKDPTNAIEYGRRAIGIRPEYPDAYHNLGQIYYNQRKWQEAEKNILLGLTKRPPYYSIIVYNPRDYDFHPLMLLAKTYFQLSRPDQAITCLQGCLKIQPKNKGVELMIKELERENAKFNKALKIVEKLRKITDKKKLKTALDKVPKELESHPQICLIRNAHFFKTKSSGKDITYYCGMTDFEWSPIMAQTKGIGGSEEAVINLTKGWAKQGYNVTVYANCGIEDLECDGVHWKPFWKFNIRDKTDVCILWRTPIPIDHPINASKVFVDMHDVIPEGEFTHERLEKITRVFVKTQFHRSLFPSIPDEKISVVPNGMDFELFNQEIQRDPHLLVNTSSPDRSMDVLPKLFKKVKEQVPEAKLKWAYGWEIFDISHSSNSQMMTWKTQVIKEMQEAGIEDCGRLSQKEAAKLYLEGTVLAYPSEFAEIDCISVKKAQACGCFPVVTDFGAFPESVKEGIMIHSYKNKNNWCRPNQISFGLEDEEMQVAWVSAVVQILKEQPNNRVKMREEMERFNWEVIAKEWQNQF